MAEERIGDTAQALQFITTEHFVLQTARSATIQEANQRATLFLTSVSSATVALAFVAQVTKMGDTFVVFSLVLLPCLFFIGLTTFVRAVQVAIEDMVHARGMARIRHYYAEQAPDIRRYLIHSIHDDESAVLVDKGLASSHWQAFMSTAGMVSVVTAVIVAAFGGVMAAAVLNAWLAIAVGIALFLVTIVLLRRHHVKAWANAERKLAVMCPSD